MRIFLAKVARTRRVRATLFPAWIALGIVIGLQLPLAAQTPQETVSAQRLQQQKQVEQQASDIARQLVGEVLDMQLQQFRDNNLTSHPWYGEIRSMRDHLDEMVKKRMKEVVDILEKADLNDDAQRLAAFQTARAKSREILVRIQVEQQILLRRLKIAALARQIQQLIEHQTKVRKETEALPAELPDHRHELNLEALEDQRDVSASFGLFKQGLRETSRFSGGLGREASEAVQMMEKQQIDGMLAKAEAGLHSGDFTAASGSQKDIIAALEALLQKIRNLQKTLDANSLEEKIAEALKEQEEIRDASEKKPLEPEVADKLAAQEDKLAKKIDELSASAKPQVQAALEQAKHEAQEAAASLLEQKQPEALAHEDKAALDLKAAAHEAEKSQSAADSKKSESPEDAKRQELENKIDQLVSAAEKLEKAAQTERQIAKEADQAAEKGLKSDQAAGLEKKNQEATEDTKSAQTQIADSVPKATEEVNSALEAMKDASHDLNKAQQPKSADAPKAGDQAKTNDAQKAPDAQKAADKPKTDDAQKPDDQAKTENPAKADAAQTEQAAPEAKAAAQDTEKHAGEAAKDLDKAAEEVRKEAQKAADELAKLSQDEGDKLANLQQKVDKELDKAMDPTADRLNALAQAQKKVDEALQHQGEADKAAEKAQPAEKPKSDQPDASDKSDKPAADKPAADKPAADPQGADQASGDKADPDKADPQAQVSEASKQAADLAQAGAPKAAETLAKATALSDQTRQEGSHDAPQKAAEDRHATRQALEEAKKELGDAIQQLAAEATKQLGEEAKETGELAAEAKPLDAEAAQDLGDAQQAADAPAPAPAEMQADQNGVRQGLAQASAELAARQQQIAAEAAHAQAEAQGNEQAGQHAGQHPEQGQMSLGHRSTQGAKKMSAGGAASPDGKEPGGADIRNEPWFAKLPPSARDTMRSNTQRRPPPGYERRTQEYFENLDR